MSDDAKMMNRHEAMKLLMVWGGKEGDARPGDAVTGSYTQLVAIVAGLIGEAEQLQERVAELEELERAMLAVVNASLETPHRSTRPEMQAVFDVMEKLGHIMPRKFGGDA